MRRSRLEELLAGHGAEDYREQYQFICDLIQSGKLKPVKNSPLNGKKPALHQSYWVLGEEEDYSDYLEEIRFELEPVISTDYYLGHPEVYAKERMWVLQLNAFFRAERKGFFGNEQDESADAWKETTEKCQDVKNRRLISCNERSFEIWGREKFLQKEQGRRVLKHCGLKPEDLGIYRTTEPLAYYCGSRKVPQTILILENKDTFYSMRRYLLEGGKRIFGAEIGTLIYGAGKGILRSFEDFRFCVEPYMHAKENRLLYFGDLDYEGIGIYERLAELFQKEAAIHPFEKAYLYMLEKYRKRGVEFLPDSSKKQNRNISGAFFSFFSEEAAGEMKQILEQGKYIPQESLNLNDIMTKLCEGEQNAI